MCTILCGSVCDGLSRLEVISFDSYNESGALLQTIQNHKRRTGRYPKDVLADKRHRTRKNIRLSKELKIRLAGPALSRPKKDKQRDKVQAYIDSLGEQTLFQMLTLINTSRLFSHSLDGYDMDATTLFSHILFVAIL